MIICGVIGVLVVSSSQAIFRFFFYFFFPGKGLTIVCSVIEGEYHKMFSEAQAAKLVIYVLHFPECIRKILMLKYKLLPKHCTILIIKYKYILEK